MFRVIPRLRFIEPQLASAVDQPPEGKHWIHEIKHDGYRSQVVIERGHARVFTRNGSHPAPLPQNGVSNFEALASAIRRQPHSIILYAFDLLHLDGKDLRKETLSERRAVSKNLIVDDPHSRIQSAMSSMVTVLPYSKPALSGASSPNTHWHLIALAAARLGSRPNASPSPLSWWSAQTRDRKTGALMALLAHSDGLKYAGAAFITLGGNERVLGRTQVIAGYGCKVVPA